MMPGAFLPAYAHYIANVHGLPGINMNFGVRGNSAFQQSFVPNGDWSCGGDVNYRLQSTPNWPFSGTSSAGFPHAGNPNQFPLGPKGWRNGDWICNCGFHNYSSRTQCKECNAPLPSCAPLSAVSSAVSDVYPTLGTKRLASEEFVNDWDNKRLNAGDINRHFMTNGQQRSYEDFKQVAAPSNALTPGMYSKYLAGNSATALFAQGNMQVQQLATMPALVGKGAKQWRDGDWMCSKCDNHNFASRPCCNRCKTPKEAPEQPASAS